MIFLRLRKPLSFTRVGTEKDQVEMPEGAYLVAHAARHIDHHRATCYFDVYTSEGGHYRWLVLESDVKAVTPLEQLALQASA